MKASILKECPYYLTNWAVDENGEPMVVYHGTERTEVKRIRRYGEQDVRRAADEREDGQEQAEKPWFS